MIPEAGRESWPLVSDCPNVPYIVGAMTRFGGGRGFLRFLIPGNRVCGRAGKVRLAGVEPATCGLGNRCSIL